MTREHLISGWGMGAWELQGSSKGRHRAPRQVPHLLLCAVHFVHCGKGSGCWGRGRGRKCSTGRRDCVVDRAPPFFPVGLP